MQDGIARSSLQESAPDRFVTLRRELGVTSFGINQLVLQPGQRMRIHRHHHQEEVYLVLAGKLTVYVEQDAHELKPGDLMRVAPEVRRQLVNLGSEPVSVLALGAAGEHQSRDAQAFTGWEDQTGATPQEVPLPADLTPEQRR
jgi:quercetin dioxygenase-like cupin family protein